MMTEEIRSSTGFGECLLPCSPEFVPYRLVHKNVEIKIHGIQILPVVILQNEELHCMKLSERRVTSRGVELGGGGCWLKGGKFLSIIFSG
jgi:hypothetical protein